MADLYVFFVQLNFLWMLHSGGLLWSIPWKQPVQSKASQLRSVQKVFYNESIHLNTLQTFRIGPQKRNAWSLNGMICNPTDLETNTSYFFLCSFPASKGVRLRFRRFGEVTKMLPCCSSCSSWSSLTWNVGKIRTIRRSIWWSCKKMGCWGPFQRCGSIKSYKDPYISCFSRSDYPWCGWRTMKWQSWWSPWYDDDSSSSSSSPSNRNASFSSALSEWRLAPSDTAARGGSKCMTSQEAAKQPIISGQWQLCHTVKGWKGWTWWAKTQVGHATRSQFG